MVTIDGFDQFGQYSSLELKNKLRRLKFNRINNFIESSLNKTYKLYKKNKNSNITFMDYRTLMLKELEKKKDSKNNKPPLPSKINNYKDDTSYFISEEESSICSI
jgi:hypothetical protein